MKIADYSIWADGQVAAWQAAFDARVRRHMSDRDSDCSAAALMALAGTVERGPALVQIDHFAVEVRI